MSRVLKVNPTFYNSFSKFLQKEAMKFENIHRVTNTVKNKIRDTKLTQRDLEILETLNHESIKKALLGNSNLSFKYKYKLLIKQKLYLKPLCTYSCIRTLSSEKQVKAKNNILKHYENYFFQSDENPENCLSHMGSIFNSEDKIPLTHIVKYSSVYNMINNKRFYSWNTAFDYSNIIKQMSIKDINYYMIELFKTDKTNKDYDNMSSAINSYCAQQQNPTRLSPIWKQIDIVSLIKPLLSDICSDSIKTIVDSIYNLVNMKYISYKKGYELIKMLDVTNIKNCYTGFLVSLLKDKNLKGVEQT